MTEPQEFDIINRVLDGEIDAFALLIEHHQSLLLRVITGTLCDQRHLAEEISQDVLVEAFRRLPDFDPSRSSFRSWLLMIARSRAINALRKKRPICAAAVPDIPHADTGIYTDEWRLLDEALHRLPPKQKRALICAMAAIGKFLTALRISS